MGSGASAGLQASVNAVTDDDLAKVLATLSANDRQRMIAALGAEATADAGGDFWASMMEHKGPYNAQDCGPPPDYSKPESWFHYGEDGSTGAEIVVQGEMKPPAEARPADCFYIHPTTYYGSLWNQPLSDTAPTDATMFYVATEASAFNGSCRMYVPRFRQATLAAMMYAEEGRQAIDTGYTDIKSAFEHFLRDRNNGRPLVIASHSQGSLYCTRLLQDYVEGKPLFKQLVAVYAIAAWVPLGMFEGDTAVFKDIKLCKAADSVGCVISYNCEIQETADAHGLVKESGKTEEENWYPQPGHKVGEEWRLAHAQPFVGTNPLTWTSNGKGSGALEPWLGMLELFNGGTTNSSGPVSSMDALTELTMTQVPTGLKANSLGKLMSNELKEIIESSYVHEKSGDLVVGKLPVQIAGSSCEQSCEAMNFLLFYFNIRANLAVRVKAFQL